MLGSWFTSSLPFFVLQWFDDLDLPQLLAVVACLFLKEVEIVTPHNIRIA